MNWNCQRCDFELVEIQKETILKIIDELNPNILSIPEGWESGGNKWIKICPSCDNHPLGFKMEKAYPIRTQCGELTNINNLDFVQAHQHTEYQREVLESEICGCFACCQIFPPGEINEWHGEECEDYDPIALCPKCGIDSVIGSASGYPIKEAFLGKMKAFWFSPSGYSETMGSSAVD